MGALAIRRGMKVALALAAVMPAAQALAINVQPVIVDLLATGRRASSVVTFENTFSEPVPVEVTVHPVRVVNGELKEIEDEEVENVLAFPSQAVVAPGASQAFRVQWVGDPRPAGSEHFYVTIAQLPVALDPTKNTIQVLHRFRILVSVNPADAKPAFKVVTASVTTGEGGKPRPSLTISNTGDAYGYVAYHRMTIVERDPAGRELFRQTYQPEQIQQVMGLGIVPSGQTRVLPIGVELPSADGQVSIEIAADDGG